MKVISLQEPYATFIAKGYKLIETRSWQTNYRGEILIHASKSKNFLNKIKNPEVLNLLNKVNLNYGKIICKAELVDCIEMTESFIEEIKNNNKEEYLLGVYEKGRYAWILRNVQLLDRPIEANGKLNIWEYPIESKSIR